VSAVHALIRVWLTDRPGALGQVASRIGAVRADIVAIDVLERGEGVAIDEFAVLLDDEALVPLLITEIEQVDGASVEQVKTVDHFPDARLDALHTAAVLHDASSVPELERVVCDLIQREFLADWVALVGADCLLGTAGDGMPPAETVRMIAMGLAGSGAAMSAATGPDTLAAAVLERHGATLVVHRDVPPFRQREREQLQLLARITDRMLGLLRTA
jgi:hypothetical protein